MKPNLLVVAAASCAVLAGPAIAQQGVMVTRAESEALYATINAACAGGPIKNKACGVMVYTPEDCAKEKDPHARVIYNSYPDGSVRFQAGTQVQRNKPGALLAGVGIFNKKGETTRYVSPVFLSWEAYSAGQKTMKICDKDARINVRDFEIPSSVEKFLKANP